MFRALSFTRKITGLATRSPLLPSCQPLVSRHLAQNPMHFGFSENKGGLPRNKEEAWMQQEQQRLKEGPNDADDGNTYSGFNRYGVMAISILGGSLLYLIMYAEEKSQQNLDFYEEDITGLKELKESKANVGGDWTLVDTEGKPFSSNNLSGYYYLAYFGFTNCPDTTPSALYYLSTVYRVIRNIPEGAYLRLKIVFISIDPERDTPPKIKSFLSHFNKNIIGVTASDPNDIQIRELMKNFKIAKKKVYRDGAKEDDYNIDHTTRIFLMDPENNYLDHVDPSLTEQQAAKAIVGKIITNEHKKEKQLQTVGA